MSSEFYERPAPVRNDDPPEQDFIEDCEECGQPLDDCICDFEDDDDDSDDDEEEDEDE